MSSSNKKPKAGQSENTWTMCIRAEARRKHRSLKSEMMIALLSHGPAHYAAVKWFDNQDALAMRPNEKGQR